MTRLGTWFIAFLCLAETSHAGAAPVVPSDARQGFTQVVVYTRTGCPYCEEATEFLREAERARPELRVEVRNIAEDPDARQAFLDEVERLRIERPGVPLVVLDTGFLIGWRFPGSAARLGELLDWEPRAWEQWGPAEPGETREAGDDPGLPEWLALERHGLPVFTIALGLLDGFNPCAMWVLLFLLSMLVHVKSRKRMFLIAGIFVLVSGAVYYLFMVAWLNLSLAFRWSEGLRYAIGGLGLTAALFHLKDALAGPRGPSLSIPDSRRQGIGQRIRDVITARNLPLAIAAVTVLAIIVNFYELLCTAGLPAIYTQVLARQEISGGAFYGYLALYNLAYIFDDALMVFGATWALSSRRLSASSGRWLKGLSGAALLLLSLILIFRPAWLSFA
ncbi:MAG: glutaredoxin family protein [Xanthomonadales bacterium]|jgi:glutaredoxin|nr:glutaredoxin family protein [Xanthomonadales bacterium]